MDFEEKVLSCSSDSRCTVASSEATRAARPALAPRSAGPPRAPEWVAHDIANNPDFKNAMLSTRAFKEVLAETCANPPLQLHPLQHAAELMEKVAQRPTSASIWSSP